MSHLEYDSYRWWFTQVMIHTDDDLHRWWFWCWCQWNFTHSLSSMMIHTYVNEWWFTQMWIMIHTNVNDDPHKCQWWFTHMSMMIHTNVNDGSHKCQWWFTQMFMTNHTDINDDSCPLKLSFILLNLFRQSQISC